MAKYSFEFKLKVVQAYLDGQGGYGLLSTKYGIKSESQLRRWVNAYQMFGAESLLRKRKNQTYSVQFKLDAIQLYQTTEFSYREAANILEMNNSALLVGWVKKFREEGIDGFSHPKGCPTAMVKPKENEPKKKMKLPVSDKERIKELEKRVRTLEIQNAFLKELRKLRKQEAQQRRQNQSSESSQASEDHSN